jgi:hypothetical protein
VGNDIADDSAAIWFDNLQVQPHRTGAASFGIFPGWIRSRNRSTSYTRAWYARNCPGNAQHRTRSAQ